MKKTLDVTADLFKQIVDEINELRRMMLLLINFEDRISKLEEYKNELPCPICNGEGMTYSCEKDRAENPNAFLWCWACSGKGKLGIYRKNPKCIGKKED